MYNIQLIVIIAILLFVAGDELLFLQAVIFVYLNAFKMNSSIQDI